VEKFRAGDPPPKSSGGGDPNVLQLKNANRIRLIDSAEDGVGAWRQHTIKNLDDPDDNGKVKFVPCPGPKLCPLCRKPTRRDEEGKSVQNFPVSRRFATNIWDYESNSIKVLIGGPQIFEEFAAAREVGLDPLAQDWIIHKTGSGIGTKYKLVRDNPTPFAHQDQVTVDNLINFDKYGSAPSPEKIFELLEEQGWDYDALVAPSFTEQEALEFVLPYGKAVKGMTVEQALAQDPGFCEWLHGKKREDEAYFDEVYLALDTAMVAQGMVKPVEEEEQTHAPAPSTEAEPPAQPAAATPPPAPAAPEPNMVTLIDLAGEEQTVPAEAADALIGAGYKRKEQETTAPPPEPEPAATPDPAPIGTTAQVKVKINGQSLDMTFKQALDVQRTGLGVEWEAPEGAGDFATFLISTGGEPPSLEEAVASSMTQSAAEDAMHKEGQDPQADPTPQQDDKPFKCKEPDCDWSGKTSGALTQHYNRVHAPQGGAPAAADPAPAPTAGAPAAAQEGAAGASGEDRAVVFERVKALLAKQPEGDYRKVLEIFEEVANTRDLSEFTAEQLLEVERRLQA
jgi:hypothetical protein